MHSNVCVASVAPRLRGLVVLGALLCAAALVPSTAGAQSGSAPRGAAAAPGAETPDTAWAYQLAHELMSPFCPGSTLAACTSSQAEELRFWMVAQAAAGASREELIAVLEARYGDQIRSVPRAEGWGATAFAVPLGLALVGGAVVAIVLRRMVGRNAPGPGDGPGDGASSSTGAASPSDELARRVDAEIAG